MIIFFILSVIVLLIGLYDLQQAKAIRVQRTEQINQIRKQIQEQKHRLQVLQKQTETCEFYVSNSKQQLNTLHQEQQKLKKEFEDKQKTLSSFYSTLQNNSSKAYENYLSVLDKSYTQAENKYQEDLDDINLRREQAQEELDQIKSVIQAATAARLREQEEQDKKLFYSIQIPNDQLMDAIYLQEFKTKLHDPTIVSKLIWSSYIMKPTTDMCNRVLKSSKPVCGIYKITNKMTGQSYVGQSVDIATRWKQHIKCGLGIDAPSTNKLYNNMQESGVWNFTFELLQTCSREKLNEKERFWIEMYESNKVGLNITKGNKI